LNQSTKVYDLTGSNTRGGADLKTAILKAWLAPAVVFHSDHLELSEQFDATSGYEKSVANLSWSYASFLSALRARNAI